jgi:Protein of unknown function (DUF1275)
MRQVSRIIPPLLCFVAGYLDSCTFLALFGLFVSQVTGSLLYWLGRCPPLSCLPLTLSNVPFGNKADIRLCASMRVAAFQTDP